MNQNQTETIIRARVCQIQKERYQILINAEEKWARLKGSQFYQNQNQMEYPAVGDWVEVYDNPTGEAVIYEILPRTSCFFRFNKSFEGVTQKIGKQVVAANFDLVFLTESLNQDFNLRRMERYLASAWDSGAVPVILLTKADLCPQWEEQVNKMRQIAPGIDVLAVSVLTGQGMEELKAYLKPGITAVFLGSSGIGKSSLVNALAGEERMTTSQIREDDDKGRHTTTYRQLITLPGGAMIIDTPGMRALGLLNVEEGVSETFADVEILAKKCRFRDCRHENEPGCAVRQAIEEGRLPAERLRSYQKLKKEAEHQAAKMRRLKQKAGKQKKHYSSDEF